MSSSSDGYHAHSRAASLAADPRSVLGSGAARSRQQPGLALALALGDYSYRSQRSRSCGRGGILKPNLRPFRQFAVLAVAWALAAEQSLLIDDRATLGVMPAVGDLVRCTDGSWMVRPPERCPRRHRLPPGRTLVGHQPCDCVGGHTTWTCLACGGGVRAAANGRVPCPGWPGRGAVTAVCQPATAAVIAARISSSSTVSVIGTTRCLPPLPWRRLAAVRSKTAPVSRGEAPNARVSRFSRLPCRAG